MGTTEEGIGELAEIEAKDQTREIDMSFRQLISSHWERDQQGFDRGVGLFFADESITLCTDELVGSEDGLDFVPGSSPVTTRRYILRRICFPGEESTGGEGGLKVGKEENLKGIIEQEDE